MVVENKKGRKMYNSAWIVHFSLSLCWRRPIFPGRFQPSIFGTDELNFRVRNGNGWTLAAIGTNYCGSVFRRSLYKTGCPDLYLIHFSKMVTRTRFELVLPA